MTSPDDEEVVTGSCLCRAVTYRATGKPLFNTICHCYNCRKVSGAPMMGSSVYLAHQVTLAKSEYLMIYEDTNTDSGMAYRRHFCKRCGGQIGGQSAAAEQVFAINHGSLDAQYADLWRPTNEQYCQTKAAFLPALVQNSEHSGRFVRHMLGPKVEDGAAS